MNNSIDSGRTFQIDIDLGDSHQINSSESHNVKYIPKNLDNNNNNNNNNMSNVLDEDIDWKSHCHSNKTDLSQQNATKRAFRQLMASTLLCFIFMTAEIIGGALANSLAIMTDASHMLSDLISFLLGLFALWLSRRKPTRRMSFGYHRAEVLGALVSMIIIWIVTAILVYIAIKRIIDNDYEINSIPMLIVAGLGVAMNLAMGLTLSDKFCGKKKDENVETSHGHQHSHKSHGHSHSSHGHSHINMNVRAAFIHVLGDLIQSIGVLIAALIIYFKPEYKIADPICTFIFSLLVLITTFSVMKDAFFVLMESFPSHIDYSSVKDMLQRIESVESVHSLHIWSLTLEKSALAVHLAIQSNSDPEEVLRLAEGVIRKEYGIDNTNIQVEKFNPNVMNKCNNCKSL